MKECFLTTIDNPFDPFKQWDDWFRYDEDHGYHSCAYLARVSKTSDALSLAENQEEIERAIDEIIKYNPEKIYTKVYKE